MVIKMKKWNIPNKLTFARIIAAPINMAILMIPDSLLSFEITRFIAGIVFILTSITDMLDGKIARKYNLITDFGKFMDPIADKIMVSGMLLCICIRCENLKYLYFIATAVVIFREFAVTSMRLVLANENVVVAANKLGKIKTVLQIVCISCALIEPVLYSAIEGLFPKIELSLLSSVLPLTWVSTVLMIVFTVLSGVTYISKYWKHLDPEK